MNRLVLIGTIVFKGKVNDLNGDEGIILETNELSFNGNEEYTHAHPIALSKNEMKAVKKGMRVKVVGKFKRVELDENTRRTRIAVTALTPNYEGNDFNMGEVEGTARRSFQYWRATADQQAFGNVLVDVEGLTVRCALFQPTCHRFSQECTTGSLVRIAGRIQHRQYVDRRTGDPTKMTEIVGNDDLSQVLESKEIVNPLDALIEEDIAEAI